jgi:small GTP-binding protein
MERPFRPFRVVMIGDSQVGKTTIAHTIAERPIDLPQPTLGAAVLHNLPIQCASTDSSIIINLWDTAGQERYRSLGPMYYKNADAAMAVFDLTNMQSFENLGHWIDAFCEVVATGVVFILGNKRDLIDESAAADPRIEEYVSKRRLRHYVTSGKTGEGIREAFAQLADDLVAQAGTVSIEQTGVMLHRTQAQAEPGCCGG